MANIGIDFGTTNSLLVAYDKRLNKFTYFSYDGERPVPISSTVWYHDDQIVVGSEARENIYKYGEMAGHHFEKSIKLRLGTEYQANVFGSKKLPSSIASEILKNIKKEAIEVWKADKAGVDLKKAVFTVPINFSGKARRDLRNAANEAGIEVSTFIHEPFAAIVGYYFTKQKSTFEDIITEIKTLDGKHILTFDWGGGTLDITVVKIENGKMQEFGTAELTGQAGDKFDEDIAKWAWNKYLDKIEKGKYTEEYLETWRKKKWGRMLAIAEACKIELSEEQETFFLLENVLPDEDEGIDEILSREEFSQLIGGTIDKACAQIDAALAQAKITDTNIDCVLLTGGTCCIPAIQERLIEKYGHRVETIHNADLVIAQGAAVVSELGWLPFLTKDIQIELSYNAYWAILEKGRPIAPGEDIYVTETFTCVDQRQKIAKLIISDGVEQTRDSILAIINVDMLGDSRFGDDIHLEACLDTDIILHISANSLMCKGYGTQENYATVKNAEIYKLCFGLEIAG